jgi:hypothetical protein
MEETTTTLVRTRRIGSRHIHIVVILAFMLAHQYFFGRSTNNSNSNDSSSSTDNQQREIMTMTPVEIPEPLLTLVPVQTERNTTTPTNKATSKSTSFQSSKQLLGMPHRPPVGTKLNISATSKVLVVYSGPTDLVVDPKSLKFDPETNCIA